MKTLFLLIILNFSLACAAQKKVNIEELEKHVGDSVIVDGVVSTRDQPYIANDTTTRIIDIGTDGKNHLLTIIVWGKERNKFEDNIGSVMWDRKVRVRGKVELYNGMPLIVIHNKNQFQYLDAIKIDIGN